MQIKEETKMIVPECEIKCESESSEDSLTLFCMICNKSLADAEEMNEHQSKTNHHNFELLGSIESYSEEMQYGFDYFQKLQKSQSLLSSCKDESEDEFNCKLDAFLSHNEEFILQLKYEFSKIFMVELDCKKFKKYFDLF